MWLFWCLKSSCEYHVSATQSFERSFKWGTSTTWASVSKVTRLERKTWRQTSLSRWPDRGPDWWIGVELCVQSPIKSQPHGGWSLSQELATGLEISSFERGIVTIRLGCKLVQLFLVSWLSICELFGSWALCDVFGLPKFCTVVSTW